MVEENKIINKEFELNSQSSELGELFKALAKARSEFDLINKDKQAYNRAKYANLASIIAATIPALSRNGLTIYQNTIKYQKEFYVETMVGHESGQFIRRCSALFPLGEMPRSKSRDEMQDYGSCITYVKKYAYKSVLGIEADEYDDGLENTTTQQNSSPKKIGPRYEPIEKISSDQLDILQRTIGDDIEIATDMLKRMNLNRLSDMPRNVFARVIEKVREIKDLKKNRTQDS